MRAERGKREEEFILEWLRARESQLTWEQGKKGKFPPPEANKQESDCLENACLIYFLSLRVFELSLRPTPTFGSTTCVCVTLSAKGKLGQWEGRGGEKPAGGGETHWERGRRTEKWREILCSPWTTVTSGHLSNHWWFRETCKCRLLTGLTAPLPFASSWLGDRRLFGIEILCCGDAGWAAEFYLKPLLSLCMDNYRNRIKFKIGKGFVKRQYEEQLAEGKTVLHEPESPSCSVLWWGVVSHFHITQPAMRVCVPGQK